MDKETKRAYITWDNIKRRCYNVDHKDYSSYGGVGVVMCEEWEDFKAFKAWYFENYYSIDGEYMAIDKDILGGDKKIYSPETCIFVPFRINGMLVHKENGDMRGIQKRGKRYEVKVRNTLSGKNEYCGMYESLEIASKVYRECKTIIFKGVVEEYKNKLPFKLYEILSTFKL